MKKFERINYYDYYHQSVIITTILKKQPVSGRQRKVFYSLQSCLASFRKIQQIGLAKRI